MTPTIRGLHFSLRLTLTATVRHLEVNVKKIAKITPDLENSEIYDREESRDKTCVTLVYIKV